MKFKSKYLMAIWLLVLTVVTTVFGSDQSAQLLMALDRFNNCETEVCARRYLDGLMLEQFSSLKPEMVSKFLKDSKLATFKSEAKFNGENAALYVSDYKYVNRPAVQGGVTMVYLFKRQKGGWRIYHRLTPDKVGSDLKPMTDSK